MYTVYTYKCMVLANPSALRTRACVRSYLRHVEVIHKHNKLFTAGGPKHILHGVACVWVCM